jgi:hypothetical protein
VSSAQDQLSPGARSFFTCKRTARRRQPSELIELIAPIRSILAGLWRHRSSPALGLNRAARALPASRLHAGLMMPRFNLHKVSAVVGRFTEERKEQRGVRWMCAMAKAACHCREQLGPPLECYLRVLLVELLVGSRVVRCSGLVTVPVEHSRHARRVRRRSRALE